MGDRTEVVVDDQVRRSGGGEHPAALPLLHECAEALVVAAPLHPHLLVLLGAQVVHGAEEDRGVVEVLDGGDDHVGRGLAQPLLDGCVGVREGVEPLLLEPQHPGVDLLEEVLLGTEVVVQRPLGDAGRLDDLLDRGAVVPLLGEEPGGGGQQPLGNGSTAPVRRLGHSRHLPSVLWVSRSHGVNAAPA